MFESPFYDLLGFLSPGVMQAYVILMFLAVVGGTVFDTIHKRSAQYFFENAEKAQASAKRTVGSGEKVSLAVSTVANEVLTSSEFCNPQRRMSHLLTMYGFVIFVVTTVMMIFGHPTPADPASGGLVAFWHLGALMVCGVMCRTSLARAIEPSRAVVQKYSRWLWFSCAGTAPPYISLALPYSQFEIDHQAA